MAQIVDEVMNRELFFLAPGEPARRALDHLLALGLTSAPVLDEDRRPIGVASLRDLARAAEDDVVRDRMSAPPIVVGPRDTVDEASRLLVRGDLHHAPVVDADGRAVGFVSLLDLARALLGLPVRHPDVFPRWDAALGVSWSDDRTLDGARAASVPPLGGLLALGHGGAGHPETTVTIEACDDLRARAAELVATRLAELPSLAWLLEGGRLRFRYAVVADAFARREAARRAVERIHDDERRARLGI
jgi:CBS domain-containing protein